MRGACKEAIVDAGHGGWKFALKEIIPVDWWDDFLSVEVWLKTPHSYLSFDEKLHCFVSAVSEAKKDGYDLSDWSRWAVAIKFEGDDYTYAPQTVFVMKQTNNGSSWMVTVHEIPRNIAQRIGIPE